MFNAVLISFGVALTLNLEGVTYFEKYKLSAPSILWSTVRLRAGCQHAGIPAGQQCTVSCLSYPFQIHTSFSYKRIKQQKTFPIATVEPTKFAVQYYSPYVSSISRLPCYPEDYLQLRKEHHDARCAIILYSVTFCRICRRICSFLFLWMLLCSMSPRSENYA